MPADYGLIGGLAEGLKQGLLTYQTTKNIQNQRQMEGALKGLVQDPQTGQWQPNELTQQTHQLQSIKNQHELAESQPGTPESQGILRTVRSAFDAANAQDKTYRGPRGQDAFPDTMSGAEAKEHFGLIKPNVMGAYGLGRMAPMAEVRQQALNETKDQNAIKAGEHIENNPLMKQMKGTILNLGRAKQMLNGQVPLNAYTLNLVKQDLINATAPGGSATEGKVNREMLETFAEKWNELTSKLGDISDIRQAEPEVIKQLGDLINGIEPEYRNGMANLTKELSSSYGQTTNQKTKKVVQQKLQQYAPAQQEAAPSPAPKGGSGPGGAMSFEEFMKSRGK